MLLGSFFEMPTTSSAIIAVLQLIIAVLQLIKDRDIASLPTRKTWICLAFSVV